MTLYFERARDFDAYIAARGWWDYACERRIDAYIAARRARAEIDGYFAAMKEEDADEQKKIQYEEESLLYLMQLGGVSLNTSPVEPRFEQYSKSDYGGFWENGVNLRQIAIGNIPCLDDENYYYGDDHDLIDAYTDAMIEDEDDLDEQKEIQYDKKSLSYLMQLRNIQIAIDDEDYGDDEATDEVLIDAYTDAMIEDDADEQKEMDTIVKVGVTVATPWKVRPKPVDLRLRITSSR